MGRPRFDVDFFDGTHIDDPYPMYEELRTVGRIAWNDPMQAWMVVGFDDCATVLTNKGDDFVMAVGDPDLIYWFDAPNMMMFDGEGHTRLRSLLEPCFTRSAIASWERRVREVVDDLLQPLVERPDGFDLIGDFTMIPTVIVAEMLGVPEERHQDFRRWSHNITSNLSWGHEDDATRKILEQTADELNGYMRSEVERHHAERPDDLITAMLDTPMSDEEIVSAAILLLVAGYDTTAKTMSNCVVLLERYPEVRRQLADDPSLIPAAIEEVLRFWGLLQYSPRILARDTELLGQQLEKGQMIFAMQAAANRDPSRWPDPMTFDIHRKVKAHMAFGYGPHLCLGAPLARLEIKVALERLLALAPEYALHDVEFGSSFMNRGPESGIVTVKPRAGSPA